MSNKYLNEDGLRKTIQSVASKISEKMLTKVSSVTSANPNHIYVNNTDTNNPIIDLSSDILTKLSKIDLLWEEVFNGVPPTEPVKETTPSAAINFINESITGLVASASYSINGNVLSANGSGVISINSSWLGTSISIIKKSTGVNSLDSDPQVLVVPSRPVMPSITTTANGGDLIGATTAMEYRLTPAGSWVNVVSSPVTGLSTGTYEMRIKPVAGTSFISNIVSINVTEVLAPAGWEMTYNFPGTIASITSSNGVIPLAKFTGYDSSKILDEDELYSEDLGSMADITTRLFAKFVTDADFKEVYFDNFGLGTSAPNKLQRWGYSQTPTPSIQLIGSNSTGTAIQLKLIKG